jgi:hypothetical protein
MQISDLMEAVPISLYRPLHAASQSHLYDDLFDRFGRYMRKGKDRLYFPLKLSARPVDTEFVIAADVVEALNRLDAPGANALDDYFNFHVSIRPLFNRSIMIDWTDEKAQDQYVKGIIEIEGRELRIGKLLQKCEKEYRKLLALPPMQNHTIGDTADLAKNLLDEFITLKKRFEDDPIRALKAQSSDRYTVVISRHAYDLAGMSTGRGWTSCVNLVDGGDRHYVLAHVKNGSLVAYIIRSDDTNIEHPVSRLVIDRFVNQDDPNDFILYPALDTYGAGGEAFLKMVDKFCRVANRGKANGLYCSDKTQHYPANVKKTGNSFEFNMGRPQK